VISGKPPLAALLKPDLGDKDSYLNTFLLEENVIGGQSWVAPFAPDFDFSAFHDPSESDVVQQAPLGLPPIVDQLLPLWSEDNAIRGRLWLASFGPDFNISPFSSPKGSVEIQQAPVGLSPAPQQLLPLWSEENVFHRQSWPAFFASDFDASAFPDPSGSVATQQAPLGLPPALEQPPPPQSFPCAQPGCTESFKRDSDRTRHQNTVHSARQGLHLCPVPTCPKSYGAGYSRADKVTEHLWKKHADLGYTKRVL
jgi:hypothetical protein